MSYYGFRPYVPVAMRRAQAFREVEKLKKKGLTLSPVVLEGRRIASNFWGKAWCDNLERYTDYENRLPRGRTYVRNGSVVDLQIERGLVRAMVSGSSLYKVTINIGAISQQRWQAIIKDCAGSIGSLVELLSGKLSKNVMERVCRQNDGLFPSPTEIKMSCSCPDWAGMCKHVAATLYGAGARLDAAPNLLFTLRGVDHADLVAAAAVDLPLTRTAGHRKRILANDDVAALFGVEMVPELLALKTYEKPLKCNVNSASTAPAVENEPRTPAPKTRRKRGDKRTSSMVPTVATKQYKKGDATKSGGSRKASEQPKPPKPAATTTTKSPKMQRTAVPVEPPPPAKALKSATKGQSRRHNG